MSTPGSTEVLSELESVRQDLEWGIFGGDNNGAVIPDQVDLAEYRKAIDGLIAGSWAQSPQARNVGVVDQRPTDGLRGDWVTLLAGKQLSQEAAQSLISAMSGIELGFQLPSDVKDAEAQGLLAAASGVVKADLRASDSGAGRAIFPAFVAARLAGGQSFLQALRLASFGRFDSLDATSGRIENEILAHLRCLPPLSGGESRDRSLAETIGPLRSLATSLGLQPPTTIGPPRTVKVLAVGSLICFQWLKADGSLETWAASRASLFEAHLSQFKDAVLLADGDDELHRLLDALGAKETRSIGTERREAAVKAVRLPPKTTTPRAEYVFSQASRGPETSTAPGFEIAVLDLDTRGDAGVVTLPDGSLILIDTGLSGDFVSKLNQYLQRSQQRTPPPLRLVVTHTDQDHIGGLSALLADEKIKIDELIIGRALRESPSAKDLISTIEGKGYVRHDGRGATHFVRQGVAKPLIDVSKPTQRGENFESFVLYPAKDTIVTLHHAVGALTTNDGGFIVKVVNRGVSWLLTDDMTPKTMELLLRALPPEQLQAGYLRWPHHLWFPSDGDTRATSTLQRFLAAVNAHTYLFSNTGHSSHTEGRFLKIQGFIRQHLGMDMNVLWTDKEKANLVFR